MVDNISEQLSKRPQIERYMGYMNSSLGDKIQHILPHIEGLGVLPPTILSVGAGTGVLEKAISDIVTGCRVIALDASVPMLEKINPIMNGDGELNSSAPVIPLLADAEHIPLQDSSVDAVILSSVVHEIASYKNDFQFSEGVRNFYANVARILKSGGRLILRDFVQPEDPKEELTINIGSKVEDDEMDPKEFVERFVAEFEGDDLSYIKDQIEELKRNGKWDKGAGLKVLSGHAFEILAHYSWSKSFNEEVREKYAYLPLSEYTSFISDAFASVGVESEVIKEDSYVQQGYVDHIKGRIDIKNSDGRKLDLPHFTGVIVLQKK